MKVHVIMEYAWEYNIETLPGCIGSSEDTTDGHVLRGIYPMFILELKNEIGWKGVDDRIQAGIEQRDCELYHVC
jgi:hypothetical protein